MIFVYCDLGRSPDLDRQYCKHTELEKSATIRETGRVPITDKRDNRSRTNQSPISHHHQTR